MSNLVETLDGKRPRPAMVIRLPVEGRPIVYKECASAGEEKRLDDWLLSHEELADLVTGALELRVA